MSIRLLFCAALLAFAGTAAAQPAAAPKTPSTTAKPAAQQLTPEQQQAIMKFRRSMVANAVAVIRLIDDGQEGQVWDNGSDVLKKAAKREAFVAAVSKARKAFGKVESRKFLRLYKSRIPANNSKSQPGDYFTVRFLTKFANEKQPMVEVLSYHYDTPTLLRVSGYTVEKIVPRTAPTAQQHR
jgi:hypothetical protein